MGWFSGPPQYVPTARDQYMEQRELARERRREIKADKRESARIQEQMIKDELKADAEHRKRVQAAQEEADKAAAAEEKALLSAPELRATGGNKDNPSPVVVWHHRAEPPKEMEVKRRRRGLGPVMHLPPDPVAEPLASHHTVLWNTAQYKPHVLEEFPEWKKRVEGATQDITRRYIGLFRVLRTHEMSKVFHRAGVTFDSKKRETVTGAFGVYSREVTLRNVPTLTDVVITPGGLELTYAPRLGDTAKRWTSGTTLDVLRNAFRGYGVDADNMEVSDGDGGNIVIKMNDRNPFSDYDGTGTGMWDDEKFRSLLGIDSRGREVWIGWREVSGMVVGGLGGSGKTASMLPVFRHMEGNAELFIFDGKAQRDWHPLRRIARVYDNSGDIAAPLETLQTLERLRTLRGDAIDKAYGAANFWHLTSEQRRRLNLKPVFVILDEAQVWFKVSKNKDKAKIQETILESVENLIRMGRSAGIVVIITTQRPSAESIPTDVRDNAQLRICFSVNNPTTAEMVLGVQPKGLMDPSRIPNTAKGRFVMDAEGLGLTLGQAGYMTPADLDEVLRDAHPVPDQWAVAEDILRGGGGNVPPVKAPRADATVSRPASETAELSKDVLSELSKEERDEIIRQIAIQNGWLKPDSDTEKKESEPEPQETEQAEPEPDAETASAATESGDEDTPRKVGFDL